MSRLRVALSPNYRILLPMMGPNVETTEKGYGPHTYEDKEEFQKV